MTKKCVDQEKMEKELKEFMLKINSLKSIFGLDLELIEEDRAESMPIDDLRRNEVTLKLNSFSIPFPIKGKTVTELKKFFKEKGWDFVGITSTPSIKLKKLTEES